MHAPTVIQKMFEPVDTIISRPSRMRLWAYENAYTLSFFSLMFLVTWIIMVVLAVRGG